MNNYIACCPLSQCYNLYNSHFQGQMTGLLLHWVQPCCPLLLMIIYFRYNFLLQEISFCLWYWESTSYKHMVELSVFQLSSYTSLPPLPNPPTSLSIPIASTIHTHHPYTPPYHTSQKGYHNDHSLYPSPIRKLLVWTIGTCFTCLWPPIS